MNLDPQGEAIAPGDERTCATCHVMDHKAAGRPCDGCGSWIHDECIVKCGEVPLWSHDHMICGNCAEQGCPACADAREEDATNKHNDSYRYTS